MLASAIRGEKHIACRGNIGFKILEVLASNNNIVIRTKKKKSLIGNGFFEDKEVILLKPQTFSELSGEAALYIASFLRIHPRDIIVIMEDYNLVLGQLAVAQGLDNEVHPAIPSLRQSLKSGEFVCVRVGIQGEGAQDEDRKSYIKESSLQQRVCNLSTSSMTPKLLFVHWYMEIRKKSSRNTPYKRKGKIDNCNGSSGFNWQRSDTPT